MQSGHSTGKTLLLAGAILCAAGCTVSFGHVYISEFMAVNDSTLRDDDGDFSDWIELYNEGPDAVDLEGWYLTDSDGDPRKWRFPTTPLAAGKYLVVFASNKDRAVPGETLHTNFKLSGDGEYLALIEPDGLTVDSEYAPGYPPQAADISYGLVPPVIDRQLIRVGDTGRYFVPRDASLETNWTDVGLAEGGWSSATTGIGFDAGTTWVPYVATDVAAAMAGQATLYLRMPFTLDTVSALHTMTLNVRYNDGFVAYVNGREIARANAPDEPAWNSAATTTHRFPTVDEFPVANPQSGLVAGTNILAVQALNVSPSSMDFLIEPSVTAGLSEATLANAVGTYLLEATPGEANGAGIAELGPRITEVTEQLPEVTPETVLVFTARVARTLYAVDSVQLVYRTMYNAEATLELRDDGVPPDAEANDDLYSGSVTPAGISPGQMLRWRYIATDSHDQSSRLPRFDDPLDSPEYFGTIASDASIDSRLPVLHWFVLTPSLADQRTGARCSLWFLGRFYDNVLIGLHGQSTAGFAKKSYNVDFNGGDRFVYREGEKKVKDIDLLTNWGDKSKCRNTLAYEYFRDTGHPAHFAFPVRIQRNAAFFSVADMVEDGDERYLERAGLDPDGALYKMYNRCDSSTTGVEKKTRKDEDNRDLQALIEGLDATNPDRVAYAYDHMDIPRAVNYLASFAAVNDVDHGHKNYYLYRDTDGNGEWTILHWDVDLCLGHNWTPAEHYTNDEMRVNDTYLYSRNNRFYDIVYNTPSLRGMLMRRVRTLLDEFLKPDDTPEGERYFEPRIAALLDTIDPEPGTSDADLDYTTWGSWGDLGTVRESATRIVDEYLPSRRAYLYGTQTGAHGGEIPDAQPPDARVVFGQIEFLPASGDGDQEFVELLNTNAYAVDISGWSLDGGISFTFRGGTVLAPGQSLYVSPDVVAFRRRTVSPTGGENRFVQGDYDGELADRGESLELYDANGRLVDSVTYAGVTNAYTGGLRLSELMVSPIDPECEFVELHNAGTEPAELTHVVLTGGVSFDFARNGVSWLAPDAYCLVVRNLAAFTNRYGTALAPLVAGVYTGKLDDSGEALRIVDMDAEAVVADCRYDDGRGWPLAATGAGHAYVPLVTDGQATGLLDYGGNWRAGTWLGGSPGTADPEPARTVMLNEIGAHTDTGLDPPYDSDDWIELCNASDAPVDIGGWGLSDRADNLRRYTLPTGTVIAAHGFLLLTEMHDFHTNRASETGFGLNKAGDELYLSALSGGGAGAVVDAVRFKGQLNGVALGRYPDGADDWYALAPTTNAPNAAPTNHVVISEIMFQPPAGTNGAENTDSEYIELYNPSAVPVRLANTAGGWRIDGGIEYDFATNAVLPAGGVLLLVPFDPVTNAAALAAFKAAYALETFTPSMLGPYRGKLANEGERLALELPLEPDVPGDDVAWVIVDEAIYFSMWPWPSDAAGTGAALRRTPGTGAGNAPGNWTTATPSPGVGPALIALTTPENGREFLLPFHTTLRAEVDATQVSGTVRRVEFHEGDALIADDAIAPYECGFDSGTNRATYSFFARLIDDAGTHDSAPAHVSAVGPLHVSVAGVSNITDVTAELRGRFEGCDYGDVTVYWGATDGGTNRAAWEGSAALGRVTIAGGVPAADMCYTARGLNPASSYCYRWKVERSGGTAWAATAGRFETVPYSRWPYHLAVRFPGCAAGVTLTNFPVLVRLSTDIPGFSYAGFATPDARDLRFSDEEGTVALAHERDRWDTNGISSVWVRIPVLNADTVIRAHWGNMPFTNDGVADASEVWSEGYRAVWHLGDPVALGDSASGENAVVDHATTAGDGAIGGARWCNGTTAYLDTGLDAGWCGAHIEGLTLSLWANPSAKRNAVVLGSTAAERSLSIGCRGAPRFPKWYYEAGAAVTEAPTVLDTERWHYLALVLDNGLARAAWDATSSIAVGAYGAFTPAGSPFAGAENLAGVGATNFFLGGIDELRVAGVARSHEWLRAEYATVAEATTFATYRMLPSDADGDGMADDWENAHLGGTAARPDAHADTDGVCNLDEYVAGTDPTNARSVFTVGIAREAAGTAVTFLARAASGIGYDGLSRYYDLTRGTNPANAASWIPVDGFTGILGQDQLVTYTNGAIAPRLYRARTRLR